MNREKAIQFCHKYTYKRFYQPVIFVPGCIEIRGKWDRETKELSQICFKNIAGKHVLDLGCNIGFFIREALRKGAKSAIGIDHDPIEMDIALEISAITKDKGIFKRQKIENYIPDKQFDTILMLNILHVVESPFDLIKQHLHSCKRLIVEHLDSQKVYFPIEPTKSIVSPRCFGYRRLSFFDTMWLRKHRDFSAN